MSCMNPDTAPEGRVLLLHEGIGQNLHGGKRRLRFMGNVGNKFLPGIVNPHLHLRQQLVKGIDNVLRFDIIGTAMGSSVKPSLYLR